MKARHITAISVLLMCMIVPVSGYAATYQYCNDYYCYSYDYPDFMNNTPVYSGPALYGNPGSSPQGQYAPASTYMPMSTSMPGNQGSGYGTYGGYGSTMSPTSGGGSAYGSDCSYPYFGCPQLGYGITRSYPWGDYTRCYYGADYGYYSCNEDPHQYLFDPYSGEYY